MQNATKMIVMHPDFMHQMKYLVPKPTVGQRAVGVLDDEIAKILADKNTPLSIKAKLYANALTKHAVTAQALETVSGGAPPNVTVPPPGRADAAAIEVAAAQAAAPPLEAPATPQRAVAAPATASPPARASPMGGTPAQFYSTSATPPFDVQRDLEAMFGAEEWSDMLNQPVQTFEAPSNVTPPPTVERVTKETVKKQLLGTDFSKTDKKRVDAYLDLLNSNESGIRTSSTGELIFKGETQPGTSVAEIVKDLASPKHREPFIPTGSSLVAKELISLGASIPNSARYRYSPFASELTPPESQAPVKKKRGAVSLRKVPIVLRPRTRPYTRPSQQTGTGLCGRGWIVY